MVAECWKGQLKWLKYRVLRWHTNVKIHGSSLEQLKMVISSGIWRQSQHKNTTQRVDLVKEDIDVIRENSHWSKSEQACVCSTTLNIGSSIPDASHFICNFCLWISRERDFISRCMVFWEAWQLGMALCVGCPYRMLWQLSNSECIDRKWTPTQTTTLLCILNGLIALMWLHHHSCQWTCQPAM